MQEVLVNDKHANDIWYLSDLHFDHAENQSIYAQRIKNFFEIVTAQSDVTFVLAGDFFDDFRKTEKFIAELEDQKVTCVLVLGNHDYWSGGDFTYAEVRNHLAAATSENQYAYLLLTGRVIQISDQVFIGDSGFTDFRYRAETWFERDGKTLELIDHPDSVANVGDFGVNFVELQQVRNWHIKDIQEMHAGWIEFANKQIKTLQNLIVVTHWPMFSVSPYDPISTWWQSKSALLKTDRYWSIYGHTHVSGLNGHDIAKQVGYRAKWDFAGLEFGRLVHVPATHAVAQIELAIRKYERFGVVDPVKSPDSKSRISRRGYIRAGPWQ
ncbi:MAG: metallophosphoesterase [Schleiferilactobacillus perolens]|uniref:metallophosphoesterase n=1 Tax=Schleiferilactobacillus perolens TaxID=100468 RepID=UPI0039E8E346